jgi:hypothetical protein
MITINERGILRIQAFVLAMGVVFGGGALFFSGLVFGSTVAVSATVTGTVSCASSGSLSFGTVVVSSLTNATANASSSMACTAGNGCVMQINDVGSTTEPGLWNSTASHLIGSSNDSYAATSTLAAGTEGYGIQVATTSVGAGATLAINPNFLYATSTNTVGGLTIATANYASSTAPITTAREALIYSKLATSVSTAGGSYADTLTIGCTSND